MVVETALDEAGCRIVGPFGRLAAALKSAEQDQIDAALLDVNLHGEAVFPVAEALAKRAIPFVFVTGYGAGGLPPHFRNRPALTKPYKTTAMLAALASITGGDPKR